jgi:hypothetical protein
MRAISISTGVLLSVLLSVADGTAMDSGASSANRVMVGCRHAIAEDGQEAVTQGFCLGSISAVRPARLNEPFNVLAAEALRATWLCH